MKQNLINDVIQEMMPFLNNAQAEKLQMVLQHNSPSVFTFQVMGMLRLSISFCNILPPDEQYGFPTSSGKSN